MENAPNQSEQERLQAYANDFYNKVNFMFQRRGMLDASGESRIELNPDEIAFVASAFTDNFIDTPDTIEIAMLYPTTDGTDMSNARGVMIIAQHESNDSIYSSLYTISAYCEIAGMSVTKDVLRSPKDHGNSEQELEAEAIHDDAPLDESERIMLMTLISKL